MAAPWPPAPPADAPAAVAGAAGAPPDKLLLPILGRPLAAATAASKTASAAASVLARDGLKATLPWERHNGRQVEGVDEDS